MTLPASWRKSSYSSDGQNCVAVRGDLGAVRDTKNPEPSIRVDVRALVSAVRSGRLG